MTRMMWCTALPYPISDFTGGMNPSSLRNRYDCGHARYASSSEYVTARSGVSTPRGSASVGRPALVAIACASRMYGDAFVEFFVTLECDDRDTQSRARVRA